MFEQANCTYNFSAKICDYSDSTFVQFLGETGNSVMGMEASGFKSIQREAQASQDSDGNSDVKVK